jgi:nicotinamide riboside transporter PnuC
MNAALNKWCFIVYIVANIGWIIVNIYCGLWEQIPMWIVYIIIGIYGWFTWGRKKEDGKIIPN